MQEQVQSDGLDDPEYDEKGVEYCAPVRRRELEDDALEEVPQGRLSVQVPDALCEVPTQELRIDVLHRVRELSRVEVEAEERDGDA